MLAVEPLSPPAVPNACEELVERQQSRSAAGEKAVSQRRPVRCKGEGPVWRLLWFSRAGEKGPEQG